MIKVVRARSIDTGLHQFSVIVSDNGITYVFPKDMEMFDSKNRFNLLMKKYGPTDKKTKMTADDGNGNEKAEPDDARAGMMAGAKIGGVTWPTTSRPNTCRAGGGWWVKT